MRICKFSVVLILAATPAGAEQASEGKGSISTFGELLSQHNVGLTEAALVDALRNADPKIRYLAAEKLEEDKAYGAIPAINAALTSEKMPSTRMNIAFALAQFGEASGLDTLEGNCKDPEAQPGIRTRSAEYLLRFDRESTACFDALLDIERTGTNGYRAEAASLLPKYHKLSNDGSSRALFSLVDALHSSDANVEMAAGRALADLGDARAIAELRGAIARQPEESIRDRLKQD
jgi:HEAT repeat protein